MALVRRGCPGESPFPNHMDKAQPVLFLDRDGVINIDRGYVSQISDFEWVAGAKELISRARNKGFLVIVVTNQSGIGRGYYTEQDFLKLTDWMLEQFEVDGVYYCPHDPDVGCPARKPGTGQLDSANSDFLIDWKRSLLIGDKDTDMKAAEKMGIPSYLFTGGNVLEFILKQVPEGTF